MIRSGPRTASLLLAALFLASIPALAAAGVPILVSEFDFENATGQADPQGWRELEASQDEEAYFHVADFSAEGHVVSALAGEQSMWCGLEVEDPRACHWGFAPGYGSGWRQNLSSVAFAVQGDVRLSFLVDMSLEPGYDVVFVQFEDPAGQWQDLDLYSCGAPLDCGSPNRSYTVPASEHDGSIRFRFYLTSDGAGDAETFPIGFNDPYGILIDDLTVSDATGIVSQQDFESETPGAQATVDGAWFAEANDDLYHGGVLVSGADVLQESPTVATSPMWAFFQGSTRDYGCAGHPEQLVVDTTQSIVRSPWIDVTTDVHGHAIDGDVDSLVVEFDVYRDIAEPIDDKRYTVGISTYSADCQLRRLSVTDSGVGEQKDWYRHRIEFVPEPGTQNIVIELGVSNQEFGPEDCRSHSPLFDNVSVSRIGGVVTAVGPTPRRVDVQLRQNVPNPFNPRTTIQFDVPATSRHVRLRIYDSSGRLVRTLVDGNPVAGHHTVDWNGDDRDGRPVASGVYFYELVADGVRAARKMILLE